MKRCLAVTSSWFWQGLFPALSVVAAELGACLPPGNGWHVVVIWHHGRSKAHCVKFMLGVDDLKGLLQPKWFCDCHLWLGLHHTDEKPMWEWVGGSQQLRGFPGEAWAALWSFSMGCTSEAPASLWLGGTSWSLVRMHLHGREWLNNLERGSAFYPRQPRGGLMCHCTSLLWGWSVLPDSNLGE